MYLKSYCDWQLSIRRRPRQFHGSEDLLKYSTYSVTVGVAVPVWSKLHSTHRRFPRLHRIAQIAIGAKRALAGANHTSSRHKLINGEVHETKWCKVNELEDMYVRECT